MKLRQSILPDGSRRIRPQQRMKLKLFVLPDGSVTGRYSDLTQVMGLVPQQIRRVTNVEWNDRLGVWMASTITGKPLLCAPTRKTVLEMEGGFVDQLLTQFYMCRQPDGTMVCPECKTYLGSQIRANCKGCGKSFPVVLEGLTWDDFDFKHLVWQ